MRLSCSLRLAGRSVDAPYQRAGQREVLDGLIGSIGEVLAVSSGVPDRLHGANRQKVEAVALVVGVPPAAPRNVNLRMLGVESTLHQLDADLGDAGLSLDPVLRPSTWRACGTADW